MTEHSLTRRPTLIGGDRIANDFCVCLDGRTIGRIRLAHERAGHSPGWDWHINPPLPIPSWGNGSAGSFEEARDAFQAAWERFYASLTPEAIEHWQKTAGVETR